MNGMQAIMSVENKTLLSPVFRDYGDPLLDFQDLDRFMTNMFFPQLVVRLSSGKFTPLEGLPYMERERLDPIRSGANVPMGGREALSALLLKALAASGSEAIPKILDALLENTTAFGASEDYTPETVARVEAVIREREALLSETDKQFSEFSGKFETPSGSGRAAAIRELTTADSGALSWVWYLAAKLKPILKWTSKNMFRGALLPGAVWLGQTMLTEYLGAAVTSWLTNTIYVAGATTVLSVIYQITQYLTKSRPYGDEDRAARRNIDRFMEGNRFFAELDHIIECVSVLDGYQAPATYSESFSKSWLTARDWFVRAFGASDYPSSEFDIGLAQTSPPVFAKHVVLYANMSRRIAVLVPDIDVVFTRVGASKIFASNWGPEHDTCEAKRAAYCNMSKMLISMDFRVVHLPLFRFAGSLTKVVSPVPQRKLADESNIVWGWVAGNKPLSSIPLNCDMLIPALKGAPSVSLGAIEYLVARQLATLTHASEASGDSHRSYSIRTPKVTGDIVAGFAPLPQAKDWTTCYDTVSYESGFQARDVLSSMVADLADGSVALRRLEIKTYLDSVVVAALSEPSRRVFAPVVWSEGVLGRAIDIKAQHIIQGIRESSSNTSRLNTGRPETTSGSRAGIQRAIVSDFSLLGGVLSKVGLRTFEFTHVPHSLPMHVDLYCFVPRYMSDIVSECGIMSVSGMIALRKQSPLVMRALHYTTVDLAAWRPREFGTVQTASALVQRLDSYGLAHTIRCYSHPDPKLLQIFATASRRDERSQSAGTTIPGVSGAYAMSRCEFNVYSLRMTAALESVARASYIAREDYIDANPSKPPMVGNSDAIDRVKYEYIQDSILTDNVRSTMSSLSGDAWEVWKRYAAPGRPEATELGVWPGISLNLSVIPAKYLSLVAKY